MVLTAEQYTELKKLNLDNPNTELFAVLNKIHRQGNKSKLYPVFFSNSVSKNNANQIDLGTIIQNNDMYKYMLQEIVKINK